MSRRRTIGKRNILPDPKFNDLTVAKFINMVMRDGKKEVAEKIVYDALNDAFSHNKELETEVNLLNTILNKVAPPVEVKSRRVGGATYQVPIEVRPERKETLSIRWLIDSAKKRNEQGMIKRLSSEMKDVLQNKGNALKKKEDTMRMAEANKAFSHFRF